MTDTPTNTTAKHTPQYAIDPPAAGKRRWKILVEYHGGAYRGWQRQHNVPSVQAEIETAIEQFSGEKVHVQCAGRTDAGVHATGQVAHFDLGYDVDGFRCRAAINNFLQGKDICVLEAEIAPDDFHARFSAQKRAYIYRILNRRPHPTFTRGTVWHIHQQLDVNAMHNAAQILVGTHDFTSFRATECQSNSPVKTVDYITIEHADNTSQLPSVIQGEIHMSIGARSFLHHQVRNIIGTLYKVGTGQLNNDDIKRILDARDRSAGGKTAPPDGLYLTHVGY